MDQDNNTNQDIREPAPVSFLADLPSFCEPILKPDDPSLAIWIDGWVVVPTGLHKVDWKLGELFAEEAVRYARLKKDPNWISLVCATIHYKALQGMLTPSSVETGFFSRLSKLAYAGSMN